MASPRVPACVFPITDVAMSGRSHLEQVRLLVDAGARMIEIREKGEVTAALEAELRECVRVCRAAGVVLIVNDFAELAAAVAADGVHVGQDDLSVAAARRIVGPDRLVGLSTHSRGQFAAALAEPVDYVAVGPVFGTTTKANPDPAGGRELVEHAARVLRGRMPLVAIGGIDAGNLESVVAAAQGTGTVVIPAVIGAVWKAQDAAGGFRVLRARYEAVKSESAD
jgi:thiamine-phosphate pyrophosphorylase